MKWLTFPVFCPFCRINGDSEVIATFFKGYDRAIRPNIGLYEQLLRLEIIAFNSGPNLGAQDVISKTCGIYPSPALHQLAW